MKLSNTVDGTVTQSQQFKQNNFKIQASPQAFHILSDKLYTDKESAVVRELCSNAVDAHKSIGTDKPYEVHLPTKMEPYFAVKDYGPGLSEDEVMELYTTYFYSDKIKSNDHIGCFGLGAKSPFAITKSFQIISRYNQVETTYTAFINDDGIPTIAKLSENNHKNTDDFNNGLEVRVPVTYSNEHYFCHELSNFCAHQDIIPVVNDEHWEPNKYQYIFETETAKLRPNKYDSSYYFVVMGGIRYALPREIYNILDEYSHVPVDFFVNVGDVDITPSREFITATKKNIQLIKRLFKDFIKTYTQHIFDIAVTEKFDFHKCCLIAQQLYKVPYNLRNAITTQLQDKYNVKIKSSMYVNSTHTVIKFVSGSKRNLNGFNIAHPFVIVEDDLERAGAHTLCRQYQLDNSVCVYLLSKRFITDYPQYYKDQQIDPSRVIKASTLVSKNKTKTTNKSSVSNIGKLTYEICTFDSTQNTYYTREQSLYKYWKKSTIDFNKKTTYYYVPLSANRVVDGSHLLHPHKFGNILLLYEKIIVNKFHVYGIKHKIANKLIKDGYQLVNILDKIKSYGEEIVRKRHVFWRLILQHLNYNIPYPYEYFIKYLHKNKLTNQIHDPQLRKIIRIYNAAEFYCDSQKYDLDTQKADLVQLLHNKPLCRRRFDGLIKIATDFYEKHYPLLSLLVDNEVNLTLCPHIIDYINDQYNKHKNNNQTIIFDWSDDK